MARANEASIDPITLGQTHVRWPCARADRACDSLVPRPYTQHRTARVRRLGTSLAELHDVSSFHLTSFSGRTPFITVLTFLAAACTAAQKKPVVATAMENDETRLEAFEATLRVLDQHPEYVDEFFALARKHPQALDRLLQDTAQALPDRKFAQQVAGHLGAEPAGLKSTLIATLDEIKDKPASKNAMAQAIEQRPHETVEALFSREMAVRKTVTAMLEDMHGRPAATEAFVQAMRDNREPLAEILAQHPDVLKDLTGALAKRGVNRGKSEVGGIVSKLSD